MLPLEVIFDHQDAVGDSNDGAFPASASGQSLKLSRQIRVLGASCGPGGLTRHTTQPWSSCADLAADPLARTLVVSGQTAAQLARCAALENELQSVAISAMKIQAATRSKLSKLAGRTSEAAEVLQRFAGLRY
jgi:hypothetical protein